MPAAPRPAAELRLVREAPLVDLLPARHDESWEASGVLAHDGRLAVVFDSARAVALLTQERAPSGRLVALPDGPGQGFEDLAFDPGTGHYLLLVEAVRRGSGWMARVEEYDERFDRVSHAWLDFPLPSENKGLEGLTCVQRGGQIQVFTRHDGAWPHVATVHLPTTLGFRDYSALAATGDRQAVASQESSALWTGWLDPDVWAVTDDGVVQEFPRDPQGDVVYCNVEGLTWVGPDRLVAVSDRAKPGEQDRRCRAKEESIHVFDLA